MKEKSSLTIVVNWLLLTHPILIVSSPPKFWVGLRFWASIFPGVGCQLPNIQGWVDPKGVSTFFQGWVETLYNNYTSHSPLTKIPIAQGWYEATWECYLIYGYLFQEKPRKALCFMFICRSLLHYVKTLFKIFLSCVLHGYSINQGWVTKFITFRGDCPWMGLEFFLFLGVGNSKRGGYIFWGVGWDP